MAQRSEESPASALLLRALHGLDALMELDQGGGVTLQQVADYTGKNKSTVYRWLQAFREYGLVEQNPATQSYRLGLKVLELYGKLLSVMDLRTEAAPTLLALMEETGETVHLGVYDRGEVIYLDKVEGRGAVVMRSRIGGRMSAYCTGVGKALLAHVPAAEVERVVAAGLRPRTAHTLTDRDALLRDLERVRKLGYAFDDQENEEYIRCVGVPVFNHAGQLVAAISVAGLSTRLPPERIPQLALAVRAAGERLSARLGFRSVAATTN